MSALTTARLLTVPEAAKLLRVHRATVYRKIEDGDLHAVRLGRGKSHFRIPEDELTRWLFDPAESNPA